MNLLNRGLPRYLSAVGGAWLLVMSLVADQLSLGPRLALCVPGVALAVSGFIVGELRSRSAQRERERTYDRALQASESLEAKVQSLDLSDALDSFAQRVVGGSSWRLNVYVLGEEGWRRVARRATDPHFEIGGRADMRRDESLLVRLLDKGLRDSSPPIEVTGEFPDAAVDLQAWQSAQEEWNVPSDIAVNLRLKSRRYAAGAIRLEGAGGAVIALVMEVLDPNALDEVGFRRAVTRDVLTLLAKLIEAESTVHAAREIVMEVEPWHRKLA